MKTLTLTTHDGRTITFETCNGMTHAILGCGRTFLVDFDKAVSLIKAGTGIATASLFDCRFMSHNTLGVMGGYVRNGYSG